ncbi:glycosyltransferase family 2 protein [Anabaena azotica]|uniref:Glycosyltransferase family 2 protein n=1 Tax=Anabaena azotica FACHB-119 TaxID=947527 RepID=A0ABR8D423_9NOST|nr:glycosyltransferase family 2 protein [Anabaena azotica]MBD2501914.1 glycosyltransferase family 2 protein [Anabaena azotica FACHB-119]
MNFFHKKTDFDFKVSVCICTRNRPQELSKALKSVEGSTYPAFEVIVSDDSTNDDTKTLISSYFLGVKYLDGPRKGLGANRNNILKAVTGSHVLFIDDDVVLNESFLEMMCNHLAYLADKENLEKLIVSGIENKNGQLVFPGEQSFVGWQNVSYKEGDIIKTVVINSALFPTALFKETLFDEKLVYGNDEVDLTTRAIKKGFKIKLFPEAINFHFPSEINRDYYEPYHDASRIYVTFKRYFATENHKLKAIFYLVYVFIHTVAFNWRYRGISGLIGTFRYTFPKSLLFIIDWLINDGFKSLKT